MTREEFDRLVNETVSELPYQFRRKMDNVVILVEDYPRGEMLKKYGKRNLLGVFIGVPLTKQHWEGAYHPHRVILYQKNIESISSSDEQIKEEIRTTLIHEIGHYFGFEEEELRKIQGLPPESK